MGTRGTYGFVLNGERKIAYNHFDSYPSGLGRDILEQLSELGDKEILKKAVSDIEMVNEDDSATNEQIEYCESHGTVDRGRGSGWYSLLRRHQGQILPYVEGFKYMLDGSWAFNDNDFDYSINFDDNKLEMYHWGELAEFKNLDECFGLTKEEIIDITNEWEDNIYQDED